MIFTVLYPLFSDPLLPSLPMHAKSSLTPPPSPQYASLLKSPDPSIYLRPTTSTSLKTWTCLLRGPISTPYETGVFALSIYVPPEYPLQPPIVKFVTKVFHPNVHPRTGEVSFKTQTHKTSTKNTTRTSVHSLPLLVLLKHPPPHPLPR